MILTDSGAAPAVNQDVLCLVIENIESWLEKRESKMSPHDKAELIRLLYSKICNESLENANAKIKDYMDIYDEFRKVN